MMATHVWHAIVCAIVLLLLCWAAVLGFAKWTKNSFSINLTRLRHVIEVRPVEFEPETMVFEPATL